MESNISQIELVKDINTTPSDGGYSPDFQGSYPYNLIQFQDRLYFTADDGITGGELWVSDGTRGGTQIVADIYDGDDNYSANGSSNSRNFIEFKDRLYFTADDGENGGELWVTDGTTDGTQLLADIHPNDGSDSFDNGSFPYGFTIAGDSLFFTADDGENGDELWVTDGTTKGTRLVLDINPGTTNGYFSPFEPSVDSSNPRELTAVGDLLYFTADDGENGDELWISDGTTKGTKLVKDINSGFDDSEYLYYEYGYSSLIKSRRVNNPQALDSYPEELTEFNGKIYFTADNSEQEKGLWVSDGTTEGTQQLVDLYSRANDPRYRYQIDLIQFQDRLYFSTDDGKQGEKLWVSDGTAEGTQVLKDIYNASDFIEFDDRLFFGADDGSIGNELWVTDGTPEGTQLVKDINPKINNSYGNTYPESSDPYNFTEFASRLYFTAETEETGRELWVTDGTTEGTQLVEDLYPGMYDDKSFAYPYSSYPRSLTVVGNELFFKADNGKTGTELFKLTADDVNSENPDSMSKGTGSASVSDDSNDVASSSSNSAIDVASNLNLVGGDGEDRLMGDSGDDLLNGGLGDDTLIGGGGKDTFVLNSVSGTDTIVDFELGSDALTLGAGLQFDVLAFSGNTILGDGKVLANLNVVDTESPIAEDSSAI